tara:strand:- start:138 stop:761 length:624 start_codon:yes stop_codon:yes gene_type:complete
MNTAFVLGNGESRKGITIEDLKKHGKTFACNAIYRKETPDVLVAVDPKMIFEIADTEYSKKNQVWSNFNHQYSKNKVVTNHVNWFQPSLGWSSGPTALKFAADQGHNKIYILGFDYQGHTVSKANNQFKFNNLFKDTRNYKRSQDSATFYGNWMSQTKRVLKDYPNIDFFRVIRQNAFKPHDLEFYKNFNNIDFDDFCKLYKITPQK